ncbi:unnamed protein product [Arctia plantaginis]|nr:unnamed protein product [Arctia plantaginis]
MTYKIILRKQNTASEKDNETIRTYYSCVDLLLSTSQSKYDLASGDVSRIISDTFIFGKIPPNTLKKDNFISNLLDDLNYVTQSGTATYETFLKDLSIKEIEEKVANNGITKSTSRIIDTDNVEILVCDKNTNTDTIHAVYPYDINPDVSTKRKSRPDSKRTLSVPPMMSLKTPSQILSRSTVSKAITCNMHNFQTDMILVEATNTQSDILNEIKLSKMVSKFGDISRNTIKSLFFTSTNKFPPKMRIEQYVQYMQTELLPLNIFLDKLITKCSVLGLNRNQCSSTKVPSNNTLLYKSVSMTKRKETETCEKPISNRAVFSILSDD